MSIKIIKQGVLDSLQDNGRYGYQHWGINPGGAMDRYAGRMANTLVGNNPNAAVMEIHFPAPQLLFEEDALIAITGAPWKSLVNDQEIPLWHPVFIRKNTILQWTDAPEGMRIYLAVRGGFKSEDWLGAAGTNLKAGSGGFNGRKILLGDRLFWQNSTPWIPRIWEHPNHLFQVLPWKINHDPVYQNAKTLFYVKGQEWNWLSETARFVLGSQSFQVLPASDRMGLLVNGPTLYLKEQILAAQLLRSQSINSLEAAAEEATPNAHPNKFFELLSSSVSAGTMQLLPSGQLIMLAADHQTTGGYPRIGHIISAHLPKMAQLRPGTTIRFLPIEQQAAENLLLKMEQEAHIVEVAAAEQLKIALYANGS